MQQLGRGRTCALLFALMGTLPGCILIVNDDFDELDDVCFGRLEVANDIPDLVLIPGEAYERTLKGGRYPVFYYTPGKHIEYEVEVMNRRVARAGITRDVLRVVAEGLGTTRVYVRAYDPACNVVREMYFNVEVVPNAPGL